MQSFPPSFFSRSTSLRTTLLCEQRTSLVVPSGYSTLYYQQLTRAARFLVVNRSDIWARSRFILLLMPRSRNSKISRAIRAAVREQELLLRNVPEPQRPAPREPPPIEQYDQLLRQANLRVQTIEEAIRAQHRIIPPQLLPRRQILALQIVGGVYRPAPVREVPVPVREIPAQEEDVLQIKHIEEDE